VFAGVALLIALAVAASGRYESVPQAKLQTRSARLQAPAWTRPCWPVRGFVNARCSRVVGRVIWLQRHDPDGDGDRHWLVLSRFHVRIVKLKKEVAVTKLPGVGDQLEATGVTGEGASGHTEINAQVLR
jgi:hypothetical protein